MFAVGKKKREWLCIIQVFRYYMQAQYTACMFLCSLTLYLQAPVYLYVSSLSLAEPSASCTAPPVQEGGTAVISFSLSKNVDLEGNYYLSIHKDNQTGRPV